MRQNIKVVLGSFCAALRKPTLQIGTERVQLKQSREEFPRLGAGHVG
jgi:hypothetical protein